MDDTSRKPIQNRVSEAIRDLRESLNDTQEQFAQRIHSTVRTIARYEAGDIPNAKVLAQLERLATRGIPARKKKRMRELKGTRRAASVAPVGPEQKRARAARVFRDALLSELKITYIGSPVEMALCNPHEEEMAAALLLASRGSRGSGHSGGKEGYADDWNQIHRALQRPLADIQAAFRRIDRALELLRRISAGEAVDAITNDSQLDAPTLQRMNNTFQSLLPDLSAVSRDDKFSQCVRLLRLCAQLMPPQEITQRFLNSNYEAETRLASLWAIVRGIDIKEDNASTI